MDKDVEKILPKFALIENVYVILINNENEKKVIFDCSLFETTSFNEKKYCYEVKHTNKRIYYFQENLINYACHTLTIKAQNLSYITLTLPI